MTDASRVLVGTVLPPIVLDPARSRRVPTPDLLPRLTRLACALAALALPALGVAATEMVHRGSVPEASQAAAPVTPLDGAAAPATRTRPTVRVAALEVPGGGRP